MVFVFVAVASGLLFDWALFERLKLLAAGIWSTKVEFGYFNLLFPRVIITILSSALVGLGICQQPNGVAALIIGSVLFAGANLYAIYIILSTEFN